MKFSKVGNPSARVLLGESGIDGVYNKTKIGWCTLFNRDFSGFRHNGMAQFNFVDGHVSALRFDDVESKAPETELTDFWRKEPLN